MDKFFIISMRGFVVLESQVLSNKNFNIIRKEAIDFQISRILYIER